MPTETAPKIDSNNALTWPEGTPAVSMDVRLKRKNYEPRKDRIDFDMAKYVQLLDEKKVKPKKRAKLRVNIVNPDSNEMVQPTGLTSFGKYTAGQYEKGVTNVALGEKRSREDQETPDELASANGVLLHETKHFLQDRRVSDKEPSKRERLAKYYIAKYIIPLGLIASTPHLEKYVGHGHNIDWATWGGALGSHLYARSMTMYRFAPREINARRFAKRYQEKYGDIITTSPLVDESEEPIAKAA